MQKIHEKLLRLLPFVSLIHRSAFHLVKPLSLEYETLSNSVTCKVCTMIISCLTKNLLNRNVSFWMHFKINITFKDEVYT